MLEIKNYDPYGIKYPMGPSIDIQSQLKILARHLTEYDLTLSPFACMPFSSPHELMNNIIGPRGTGKDYSDRPRILMQTFGEKMAPEAAAYPVTNTAIHWTTGVASAKEAFVQARFQTALMPFFFIYTENRPPFQDSSEQRIAMHTGLKARLALGQRGLFPDFLFAVETCDQFVERTIARILESPMMAYYDHNDHLQVAPREVTLTPSHMQGYGPETISQFEMAMSQFWYFYKLKGIPGGEGTLFERRDFDSSPEGFHDLMLVFNMIDFEPEARKSLINELEHSYGIPLFSDPSKAAGVIHSNLHSALYRGQDDKRFVDTPFGDPRLGKTVHNLLEETLLPMMEGHCRKMGLGDALKSWRFKCNARITNAQFWHDQFHTMDKQQEIIAQLTADPKAYNQRWAQPHSWPQQLYAELKLEAA